MCNAIGSEYLCSVKFLLVNAGFVAVVTSKMLLQIEINVHAYRLLHLQVLGSLSVNIQGGLGAFEGLGAAFLLGSAAAVGTCYWGQNCYLSILVALHTARVLICLLAVIN